jgi:hypothetical protein
VGCVGDKTSRWDYRKGVQPAKVREEWTIKKLLVVQYMDGMVWKHEAAPNDKIIFQTVIRQLIQMWWI